MLALEGLAKQLDTATANVHACQQLLDEMEQNEDCFTKGERDSVRSKLVELDSEHKRLQAILTRKQNVFQEQVMKLTDRLQRREDIMSKYGMLLESSLNQITPAILDNHLEMQRQREMALAIVQEDE